MSGTVITERRRLGKAGPEVSAIGLGCMSLSGVYGTSDDEAGIRLIHRAIELGVDHFDSSDMYGWGQNEELLGRALKGRRNGVVIATKFGQTRRPGGANGVDGTPAYVAQACDASLKRLGVDVIDLYYQHRVDPAVPVEETVGAMSRLVEQGKVRYLGLCEARPDASGAPTPPIPSPPCRANSRCSTGKRRPKPASSRATWASPFSPTPR